jgi:glutamate N-acetyltransferase/amino-acid N-acetyltransferase
MGQPDLKIRGFVGAAVPSGQKRDGEPDLALLFSEREAVGAGVFTTNKVRAAPVLLSEAHIQDAKVRAIVANSGIANACTGDAGLTDAKKTADLASKALDVPIEEILVASTGVIGSPLNMTGIHNVFPNLVTALTPEGIGEVAQAIMTTDSFPKISRFEGKAGMTPYSILGIAKGAGMIMPNMATMLAFIMTDLSIDGDPLREGVLIAVGKSFNRITVDGDTSTNDMVLVLANGAARNGPLSPGAYKEFVNGLGKVMEDLSRMIVEDGEGATKTVEIRVKGAFAENEALLAAKTVANSNLVKTALYGEDPNWGRIMAALGRSEITMVENEVDIWIDNVKIVSGGLGEGAAAEEQAKERMKDKAYSITIELHQGVFEDRMLTSDLTHEYIDINADYRT